MSETRYRVMLNEFSKPQMVAIQGEVCPKVVKVRSCSATGWRCRMKPDEWNHLSTTEHDAKMQYLMQCANRLDALEASVLRRRKELEDAVIYSRE